MSQEPEDDDDLQPEYDFSNAVRGKYYQSYKQGTNVTLLEEEFEIGDWLSSPAPPTQS